MAGNKHPRGFTLIEMTVATAVIGIAIAAAAGIFTYASRGEVRVRATAKLADASALVMRRLSFLVKDNDIDYAAYGGTVANPTTTLSVFADSGSTTSIFMSDKEADCGTGDASPCLMITTVDGSARLLPRDVRLDAVSFLIRPTDPAAIGAAPSVIVYMSLSLPDIPDLLPYHLQTQITTRSYDAYD